MNQHPSESVELQEKSPPKRHPVRRGLFWGTLAFLALAGLVRFVWFRAEPSPPLPDVPLESLSTASRALIERLQGEVVQNPDSGEAWGELGMAYFAHRFDAAADQSFEQAANRDPGEFRWPYFHAINLSPRDPEKARALFELALSRDNNRSVIHCRLAELLLDQQDHDLAKHHYQQAIDLDDKNARAVLGLARLELMSARLPESLKAAQRAVALAPHEKTPRAFLAEVLHRSGRSEEAEQALRIAKGLPDNPFSWHDPVAAEVLNMRRDTSWKLRQAEELISAGRYRDAVADLSDLARRETQLAEPSARLGQLLTELRDYENAERVLLDAGERFPDSSEIEFRLGVLYVFTDRLPEAIDAFKAALERNPTHFLSQYNLGQALRMNGDLDAAQDAFRRAVKLDPASILAHLALAKLLLELDDHDGAIGSLQAVLHLDSKNEEARKLLDKIPRCGQPCL